MGLIETEISELRRLLKLHEDGKVDAKYVNTQVAIYSQIEKRTGQMLKIMAMAGPKHINRLVTSTNVIGTGTAIQDSIGGYDEETVQCQEQNNTVITRRECLDYSGAPEHMEFCEQCKNFNTTSKLLLGEKK